MNGEDQHLAALYQRFQVNLARARAQGCGTLRARNTLTAWGAMESR
jgi:hypothetical protein